MQVWWYFFRHISWLYGIENQTDQLAKQPTDQTTEVRCNVPTVVQHNKQQVVCTAVRKL